MTDPILAASLEGLTYYDDVIKMNRTWNGTEWKTWGVSGPEPDSFKITISVTDGEQFELPAPSALNNMSTLDWGDGNVDTNVNIASPTHTYTTAGTYQIKVSGDMPEFRTFAATSANNIISLDDMGNIAFTALYSMFYGCVNLISANTINSNTSAVTSLASMFNNCSSLTTVNFNSFDSSNVTSFSSMFNNCTSLLNVDLSPLNSSNVTNITSMFEDCTSITSLDFTSLDTSSLMYMSYLLDGCSNLTSLDFGTFNTNGVEEMYYVFSGCSSLTSIDISSFTTPNVYAMGGLFEGCSNLTSIDLSTFDTSSVNDLSEMFYGCASLTSIDISTFNTSSVNDMVNLFRDCTSLTSVTLTGIDTSSVTTFGGAFNSIPANIPINGLESLDLSSCIDFSDLFLNTSLLTSIYNAVLNQNTGWVSRGLVNSGATMNFGTSTYSLSDADAVAGRNAIINTYGWNLVDGGGV